MEFQKDIISDLIYSTFIAIVLLVSPNESENISSLMVELFKGFIVQSLIYLWLKSISKKFKIVLFSGSGSRPKNDINLFFKNLKNLIEVKVGVLGLAFSIKFLFINDFQFDLILIRSFQIVFSTLYIFILYFALNKSKNIEWLLPIFIFIPYPIIFLINEITPFGENVILLFPYNVSVFFINGNLSTIEIIVFLVGTFALISSYIVLYRRFGNRKKNFNLPWNRIN